jgi:hypothetical protein
LQVLGFSGGERRWDFLPQMVILETAVALNSIPRWKLQKSKIHNLAHRFSVDFSLLGLAYGFLSQSPRFLFGSHKHLIKVIDFWFAVVNFKIRQQDLIFITFLCLFSLLNLFHNPIKYIINKHFKKLNKKYRFKHKQM